MLKIQIFFELRRAQFLLEIISSSAVNVFEFRMFKIVVAKLSAVFWLKVKILF